MKKDSEHYGQDDIDHLGIAAFAPSANFWKINSASA
jgi:hypothetical protein